MAGCQCPICKSGLMKNQRLRASGIFRGAGKNFLLDASPDIRMASLKYDIRNIDALFVTHPHEDHIGGMNDLRSFTFLHKQPIKLYLSEPTLEILRVRFDYLLERFEIHVLEGARGKVEVAGVPFSYFTYHQQGMQVTGFRRGSFAYVTDIKEYDASIFSDLAGVETLVLGALHETESRMHFTISEAVQFVEQIPSVKQCYLTHLSHEVEYETMSRSLPEKVQLSYDGLEVNVR